MVTRKKRRLILIIVIILVLIILLGTFVALYLNTDMFKSNQTLFAKYLGKNADNLKTLESIINKTEYDTQLETTPYNESIEAKVNYTQDIGTTEENTNNVINQLKVTVQGQTDNNAGYEYRNIQLLRNDGPVVQTEYLHSGNNYGVKFSDLFNQYLVSENTNLKQLFKKIGYTDEQIENIPDTININLDFINQLKFSDEELQSLEEKYVEIVKQNVSKTNFSKLSNQTVTINKQNYVANAYVLTLTKEQLNNIYINLLQAIEEDETILSKLDALQNKMNEVTLGNNSVNIKENLIKDIDLTVQKIRQNNIGSDETKIIVYESEGTTLRTRVETQNYQTNIDFIDLSGEKFAELLISNEETEKYRITLNYNSDTLNVEIENNDKESMITFERTQEINNQERKEKYDLLYEVDDKKVDVNIIKNIQLVQNVTNMQSFNNENAVMLNTLEDSQAQEIINTVRAGLDTKIEMVKQEIVYQDIEQMLKDIGLMKDSTVLSASGITETEKNRFNSNFELIEGENITGKNLITSIQTIRNNISGIDVVSDSELRLMITRNQGNEEIVNAVTSFLEENGNENYNISIEYDENGLVNQLILTIAEDD